MSTPPLRSVLVVNLKSLPTWHLDLAAAFTARGIAAQCFITTPQTLTERIDKSVRGRKWFESNATLARLLACCRETRPELVVFLGMFVIPARVRELLATRLDPAPRQVGWLCDCFTEPQFSPWAPADHAFYFDTYLEASLPRYYSQPARYSYLPLAADPVRYRPLVASGAERAPNLLFVGNVSPNRADLLEAVAAELPLAVYGPNAGALAGAPRASARRQRRRKLDSAAINALYNAHRVALNINQKPNTENGLNLRVFEATAAGATLLTQDCPDLPRHYRVDEELMAWHSPADLIDRCRTALADPGYCDQLATRGRERLCDEHTFDHRVRTMLEVLT